MNLGCEVPRVPEDPPVRVLADRSGRVALQAILARGGAVGAEGTLVPASGGPIPLEY